MGIVTGDTVAGCHRTMLMLLGKNLSFVTVEAKAGNLLAITTQLKTHGGLMGIMTVHTPSSTGG